MNRREFFKKAAIVAAGVLAADQLELLEKLGHSKIWTGHTFSGMPDYYKAEVGGFVFSEELLDDNLCWRVSPDEPSNQLIKINWAHWRGLYGVSDVSP